jgi:hypothetical protein
MKRSILFVMFLFIFTLMYGQCNYQVGMSDSYGDGWNGGLLDIYVDGVLVHDDATVVSGNGPVFYDLPSLTPGQTIACDYTAGSWAYENEYYILDNTSTEVFHSGAGGVEPSDHGTWVAPFYGTVACPSCPPVSGLAEANITAATADLSWVAGGTEALWNLEYGAGGFAQGTGTMVTGLVAASYALTGLTEGNWDWYVQADCGTEQSGLTGSSFYAFNPLTNDECSGAVAIGEVVDQPFNTTTATTSGVGTHSIVFDIWYVYTPAASGTVTIDLCGSGYDTKLAVWDDCAYTTELGYNDDDSITCTSRALQSAIYDIPVQAGEDYFIQVGGYGTNSGMGDITIEFMQSCCLDPILLTTSNITYNQADLDWTDITFPNSWNIEYGLSGFSQGSGTLLIVDAHPYTLTDLFQGTDYDWYVQAVYDIETTDYSGPASFTTLTSCPEPTSLTEAVIMETTADLSWTAGLSETLWNLEYGLASFTQGTGTMVTGLTSPSYSITGLAGTTEYDWYVQADCGAREVSSWVMGNFATSCAIYTAPYSEDFENAGAAPLCWTNTSTTGELWLFATSSIGHSAPNDHTGGGYFATVDDSESPHSTDVTLTTPLIDVSSLAVPQLSFWLYSDEEGSGLSMTLNIDVWDGAAWNVAFSSFTGDTVLWEQQFVNLAALTITGPIQVKFIADETSSGTSFYDDISIDDVFIDEAPLCYQPVNPMWLISNPWGLDVELSWTAGGTEELWGIQWGLTGFTPDAFPAEGTTVTGLTTESYYLTGLEEGSYEWYVRADCEEGYVSEWVGPTLIEANPPHYAVFQISLTDSNSDGWNGNSLDVQINGVPILSDITLISGAGPEVFEFDVDCADLITTVYHNMDGNPDPTFPEENAYYIYNEVGAEVGSDGVGGAIPVGISEPIYVCPPICMVTIDVPSFNFGGIVPSACHGGQNFIITNGGGAACNILTSAIIGADAGAYVLTDPNTYPVNLEPGASLPLPINVDFCPTATLPYPDTTLEITSDCFGYLSVTSDLSGIGISGVDPVCSTEDVIFSQIADVSGWNAGTSEFDTGFGIDYKCFDNYTATTDITDMRFWGLQLIYDGGFGPGSTEYPTEFLIEFWADDGTGLLPDITAPVYSEQVTLQGTPLVDVGGYFLWEWNCAFAAPVTQLTGWVSLQGQTAVQDDNWFMWISSHTNIDGDLMSCQWNGSAWTNPAAEYDYGFCLSGFGNLTPPVIAQCEVSPENDEVTISWNYVPGQIYFVYSGTDPYGSFATLEGGDIAQSNLVISPIPPTQMFYRVTTDIAPASTRITSNKKKSESPKTDLDGISAPK